MKAGIFVRVSTTAQVKIDSPQTHIDRGKMYIEHQGWEFVTTFNLGDTSGKSTREHPETQRMLKAVADREIDVLVFSSLSRLARNVPDLLYYSQHFEDHDATLVSPKE